MIQSSLAESLFGATNTNSSNLFVDIPLPDKPHHLNYSAPKITKKNKKKRKDPVERDLSPTDSDVSSKKASVVQRETSKDKSPRSKDNDEESKTTSGINTQNMDIETMMTLSHEPREDIEDEPDSMSPEDRADRTIFVGNLPLDTTRKALASMFKSCGKVLSAWLRSVPTAGVKLPPEQAGNQKLVKRIAANTKQYRTDSPKMTVNGYLLFEDISSVDKALLMNNQLIPLSNNDSVTPTMVRLRVDRSKPTHDASRSVFVGNLPYAANEATLREHFYSTCNWNQNEQDIIEAVRIVRDSNTMQCKGFGYVLFKDKTFIPDALSKTNESIYMKRELRINVCGKRCKGRQGQAKEVVTPTGGKRTFEGKRATDLTLNAATRRLVGKLKMKHSNLDSTQAALLALHATIRKRSASNPIKSVVGGVSKKAVTERKYKLKAKKIEKRIVKGMGKNKK